MAWTCSAHSNDELVHNLERAHQLKTKRIAMAMRQVDRKYYCDSNPYQDSPQPIGFGVTISAPHMHAICLELLAEHLKPGARVLDVGSGSGYLTAVMGLLVQPNGLVIGIDHSEPLVKRSISNLRIDNPQLLETGVVELRVGDGWVGVPDRAPFDAIHVGAGAEELPQELVKQLRPGGRMVIPVGSFGQDLLVVDKAADGTVTKHAAGSVMYVPLVRHRQTAS